jgi:hypothetical protein
MVSLIIICIFLIWIAYEYYKDRKLDTEEVEKFAAQYNLQRLPGESNNKLRERIWENRNK